MRIFAKTHKGLVRSSNQDTLLIAHRTYGVADGMGGHQGGETASRVAVQVLRSALQGKQPDEAALRLGLQAANRRVYEMQRHDPALAGMGTTLTVLWEDDGSVLIGHVGDSRAYLFRDSDLVQKTDDHSVVGELVRSHAITEEAARTHPYRNVITRALGTDPMVQPDIQRMDKLLGDVWLVCSDGLHGVVERAKIWELLQAGVDESTADRLIELTLEAGAPDNVSLVLGVVTEVSAP